jgi:hypothetical protein
VEQELFFNFTLRIAAILMGLLFTKLKELFVGFVEAIDFIYLNHCGWSLCAKNSTRTHPHSSFNYLLSDFYQENLARKALGFGTAPVNKSSQLENFRILLS